MLKRSVKFLIKNKILALIAVILIISIGHTTLPFNLGLDFLPKRSVSVDAMPNMGENQQIVYTKWEGQSPEDIEDQITYPLTSNLLGIAGVKSIRSNSMFGFSNIYIIFEDDIDFYWSRSRVLEKLNSLPNSLLPQNVKPKLGPDATALGQVFWYTLEGRDENGNVTGGWNLQELRSIQDFYIKNALTSTKGVSEVASIGGFVKEYQIDIKPELMKQYNISLADVIKAVEKSNRNIGAQTLEINKVEYFVRGLGYIKSDLDIENTVIKSIDFTPVFIKDIANVTIGPDERRGILDKGGAEVVGGVIASRFGENPMQVIDALKEKIDAISLSLPSKILSDGKKSQLTIIPFYDRSELIESSLTTLSNALIYEIMIAILVIVIMLMNLRVSIVISAMLPLAVFTIFIIMKIFDVEANIVALSGIAIAIGTIVDMGIIVTENIIRHLKNSKEPLTKVIIKATNEVSSAILTAGLTTIVSFIPIFLLTGAEGKLFWPLAFTKTVVLSAAIIIALFIIPSLSVYFLKENKSNKFILSIVIIVSGLVAIFYGHYLGLLILSYGIIEILESTKQLKENKVKRLRFAYIILAIILLLAIYWRPLGYTHNLTYNFIFVISLVALVLIPIYYIRRNYEKILSWVLEHKQISISIPLLAILLGVLALINSGEEFMPSLNEGDFLLMPSSMPHSGIEENNKILKMLDIAVASLPEIEYVVGKAGRVESALDPAPISMYENLIAYKPEYILGTNGKPKRFKTNSKGRFETKSGKFIDFGSGISSEELIEDNNGEYYRNWRTHIKSEEDIWKEITKVTELPGVTNSPQLQPIETRQIMLQTGMRAPMGIKIKGSNLKDVEAFSLKLENELKSISSIDSKSVFADRSVGKPYILIHINREKIARYGLSIETIQESLEASIGGKLITQTIEGRERYDIRVRYPKELRETPEDLESIYITLPSGTSLPLNEFVTITYKKGPQTIKSEDGFLVNYLIFDKNDSLSEIEAINQAKDQLISKIEEGSLIIPNGVSYEFSGTYKNFIHSQKTLRLILPIVLAIIFLILYFQFRSVTLSLMIFTSVAVAFAGGFIFMWLYSQPWFFNINLGFNNLRDLFNMETINLSVAIWVGFIALFGIATDDGVVMGTYLNQNFKNKELANINSIRMLVIEAGKKRITPCLMTSATTILALFPILTSSGKGSDIMIPMAIPILGGMLMSIITLFVVPLLFCWQKERQLLKTQRN
ncbi:efflux RND transporter permease subunit [Winogradskyella sp. PE311]|uniref:efflux RND transporter permease subunit n=1 Tax=Winogradskyella sp. PE311 TaxID=3366943 RepID=UPI00398158DB